MTLFTLSMKGIWKLVMSLKDGIDVYGRMILGKRNIGLIFALWRFIFQKRKFIFHLCKMIFENEK